MKLKKKENVKVENHNQGTLNKDKHYPLFIMTEHMYINFPFPLSKFYLAIITYNDNFDILATTLHFLKLYLSPHLQTNNTNI